MLRAEISLEREAFSLAAELRVEPGRRLALVGRSGAGKSTLLRAIAGLVRPEAGRISLGGSTWFDGDAGIDIPVERRRIGFVFQEYALFPNMSARANIAYGVRGAGRRERRARANDLLSVLGVAGRADARPADLSGGERQRVALARALATEPDLLLLDEPLSALDASTRSSAASELSRLLLETGTPAVLVTHDFAEAALLADRVAVLDGGRVVQEGAPAELTAAPKSAFVADLAGAVVLRGIARLAASGLTEVELAGGGVVVSTDRGEGPVAVSVFPWEIELHASAPSGEGDSALNRLAASVTGVTEFGNRARVALALPQPAVAEVTSASVQRLGLAPGTSVEVSWKATATRLTPG
ncbi:MAG: ABC transporter ATP-binding protein [Solirubrobacterales bacterium]